ncbi:hypothetical protein BDF20DRAFT_837905 [Mycotypha africana]|uniref:uncharacterized protein n=1 Tax=Mycotypha africana TaxID=64632 RepID=UPI00230158CC|nr:uncharacterized protein BDF20DRAFT_837905 [Mycotypha africana]KAI8971599.1 hypothetical protein BDF20DRAFT_837905 [Mycotypha africana]
MATDSPSLPSSLKPDVDSLSEPYSSNNMKDSKASNDNNNMEVSVTTAHQVSESAKPDHEPFAPILTPIKTEASPVNAVRQKSPTPPPPKLPLLQSPTVTSASLNKKASSAEPPFAAANVATNMTIPSTPRTTFAPDTNPPPPAAKNTSPNGYRPLNVKDALTYLDQVKIKFSEQPEVYNRFLDIMKEFKSQAIDTPGVIERVSTLFKGHPSLISGFNTFLPPGYRIECSTDGQSRDVIRVTTPSGTTTSTTHGEPLNLHSSSMNIAAEDFYTSQRSSNRPPSTYNHGYHESLPPISTYHHPTHATKLNPSSSSPPSFIPSQPTALGRPFSPPPPPSSASDNNALHGSRRSPVEFNQAINYVNKIKNRFANEPDTYKQFLEILQTYQKEQRPIQEVYAQVRVLFNGAEDLLTEFKQFLPDTTTQQPVMGDGGLVSSKATATSAAPTTKYKKRTLSGLPRQRRKNKYELSEVRSSSVRDGGVDLSTPLEDVTASSAVIKPIITAIEVEFFERVRKYFGSKSTYQSFLRLLNLFSQQMFDANMLIDRCEPFLGGNKELYDQLKKLVGYDGKDRVIENVPLPLKQDYVSSSAYGPSYRSVPKAWQAQNCSGRDALCWEVLNDEFVSHPTWASEDSGFIASKKNIYEEALHRVEDERYSYDMDIEANLNTITLLEPIAKKLASMTDAERVNFKLSPGIGGPSKCIYQRTIKKIYGREQGREIIDMLHNHPAQTVPVILKRLKQKDEEWRKSQREWNKVWREVEVKNYYKALDYRGVIFKTKDRKTTSVKYLVNQIEAIRLDQITPENFAVSEPQLCFKFKSRRIFKDVTRVLYRFFDRQTLYGHDDCEIMKAFIEMFLPVFFDVPDVLPETDLHNCNSDNLMEDDTTDMEDDVAMDDDVNKNNNDNDDDDNDTQNSYDSSTDTTRSTRRTNNYSRRNNGRRSPRHRTNDEDHPRLLKDVLKKSVNSTTQPRSAETKSQPFQIPPADDDEEDMVDKGQASKERKIHNLFGNTTFYCFFRLFQICYERLYKFRRLDRDYRLNGDKTKAKNKAALQLNTPSVVFNGVEIDFRNGYYRALLKLVDQFFDDEFDQYVFEECVRYIYGTEAYEIFTIDKLMLAIIRQLYCIVTDPEAQEILSFFKKNHEHEINESQLTQAYRLEVTEVLKQEDNLYNLAFDTRDRTLSIQLLEKHDKTFELYGLEDYTNYVDNYTNWDNETPGVDRKGMLQQYLKRNLKRNSTKSENVYVNSNLQYKICRNTYHMFYVVGTEDVFTNNTFEVEGTEDKSMRNDAFKAWLNRKMETYNQSVEELRQKFQ